MQPQEPVDDRTDAPNPQNINQPQSIVPNTTESRGDTLGLSPDQDIVQHSPNVQSSTLNSAQQPPIASLTTMPKHSKKSIILLGAITLVVCLGIGFAAYMLLPRTNKDSDTQPRDTNEIVEKSSKAFVDTQDQSTGSLVFSPPIDVKGWQVASDSRQGTIKYITIDNVCFVENIQEKNQSSKKINNSDKAIDAYVANLRKETQGEIKISSTLSLFTTNENKSETFSFKGKKIIYTGKNNTSYTRTVNAYTDSKNILYVVIECPSAAWDTRQKDINFLLEKGETTINRIK